MNRDVMDFLSLILLAMGQLLLLSAIVFSMAYGILYLGYAFWFAIAVSTMVGVFTVFLVNEWLFKEK